MIITVLRAQLLGSIFGLDEGDVVPLQHDPLQGLACLPLQVDLYSFVQDEVHVLVEPGDNALDASVNIFVQPDLHIKIMLKQL